MTARSIPINPLLIDVSDIRHNIGANKYILDVVSEKLNDKQKAQLSLSYRKMKDIFLQDPAITDINDMLEKMKENVTDKTLTVALNTTSKSKWEQGVMPHLDDIPFPLVGKGEQSSAKIQLAICGSAKTNIFMVEEPENHQSHTNLNTLISRLKSHAGDRQLLITTHSSFVLNKMGLESVLLFNGKTAITLADLSKDTTDYFLNLSGYNTLRLILAKEVILVEGPSDELIVQRAYKDKYGTSPIEDGVDVITVNSLAFKRFLEISEKLDIKTSVITDNDGDLPALERKYAGYAEVECVEVFFSNDAAIKTLEPQILHANNRDVLNGIFGTAHETDEALLGYMEKNKTTCALKIFQSETVITMPEYIQNAIAK